MIARIKILAIIFGVLCICPRGVFAQEANEKQNELRAAVNWEIADSVSVRQQAFEWLKLQKATAEMLTKANAIWPQEAANITAVDMLGMFTSVISLTDKRAEELVRKCSQSAVPEKLPELTWLRREKSPALLRNHLRLLLARWYTQNQLVDESLALLKDLKPEEVIDPAALLFYRSVAHHRLLHVQEAVADLEMLMQRKDEIPRRYATLARLMLADIRNVKKDSLDHIARRMNDIQRRLKLGRANERVIKIEDGVIESLDKLIKKMEEQRQQQQQVAHNRGGSNQPAQRSRFMPGKGDGKVDPKNFKDSSKKWGQIDPKKREEALQRVGQEFPSHYREVIEEYFRTIPNEKNTVPSRKLPK